MFIVGLVLVGCSEQETAPSEGISEPTLVEVTPDAFDDAELDDSSLDDLELDLADLDW